MDRELFGQMKTVMTSANLLFEKNDYTSTTILLFKTWFIALDLLLYRKIGKTPKDHSERFRLLKDVDPMLYQSLDKYYSVYRDTYSLSISKKTCEEIRSYVTKLIDGIQPKATE